MGTDPSTVDALRTRVAETEAAYQATKDEEQRLRTELIALRNELANATAAEAGWAVGDTYQYAGEDGFQADGFRLVEYRKGWELIVLGWPLTKTGKRSQRRGESHRQHLVSDRLAVTKVVIQP